MRALAGGGWGVALGLVSVVSCGGRTSTLDSDAYGSNDDGFGDGNESGSSAGGSSNGGGRPSVAGASGVGATTPSGGRPTTPGVDPSLAAAPCRAYCPGYATQCKQRLMGQDCMTACQGEVNSFGPRCQTLGIDALKCLTPFFTVGGANCDAAVNTALTSCGKVVSDFQKCKESQAPTTPSMPTMPTTPKPDITSCASMGFTDTGTCLEVYACNAGTYTVLCTYSPMTADAACSCTTPSGQTSNASFPNDGKACYRTATTLCR